jgi:hypothetical protein
MVAHYNEYTYMVAVDFNIFKVMMSAIDEDAKGVIDTVGSIIGKEELIKTCNNELTKASAGLSLLKKDENYIHCEGKDIDTIISDDKSACNLVYIRVLKRLGIKEGGFLWTKKDPTQMANSFKAFIEKEQGSTKKDISNKEGSLK